MRYSGPFLFLLAVPALFYCLGPFAALGVVAVLITVLLSAEWLVPHDTRKVSSSGAVSRGGPRLLPLLYTLLQIAILFWSVTVARTLTFFEASAVVFSSGLAAGVFGMIAAHELVHSPSYGHRAVGLALLTCLGNRQFRISHLYVHHRVAATAKDPSTARLGENFYVFLARTVREQWRQSWKFEKRRSAGRAYALLRNRLAQDVAVVAVLYLSAGWVWGIPVAMALVAEGAVALVVLELFNYIAHYGLLRRVGPDGRQEKLGLGHSWNSSNPVSNLLVFNMGRHSDHHRRPAHVYEALEAMSGAPELPAGYAGSILLALAPPLWRRVMDPRVVERSSWTQPSMPSA